MRQRRKRHPLDVRAAALEPAQVLLRKLRGESPSRREHLALEQRSVRHALGGRLAAPALQRRGKQLQCLAEQPRPLAEDERGRAALDPGLDDDREAVVDGRLEELGNRDARRRRDTPGRATQLRDRDEASLLEQADREAPAARDHEVLRRPAPQAARRAAGALPEDARSSSAEAAPGRAPAPGRPRPRRPAARASEHEVLERQPAAPAEAR